MARRGLLLLRVAAEAQIYKNLHPPAHGRNLLALNLFWLNAGVLEAAAALVGAVQRLLGGVAAAAVAAVATHIGHLKRLICRQLKL
jgi:hypothetical protein